VNERELGRAIKDKVAREIREIQEQEKNPVCDWCELGASYFITGRHGFTPIQLCIGCFQLLICEQMPCQVCREGLTAALPCLCGRKAPPPPAPPSPPPAKGWGFGEAYTVNNKTGERAPASVPLIQITPQMIEDWLGPDPEPDREPQTAPNAETPFTFNPDHKHIYRFLVQVEIPSGAHFCQCDECKPDKERLMIAALCSGLDPVRALIPQGCTVEVRAEP